MRIHVPCSVLGLALVAIAPTAQAQTVYAPQPVVTVPPATMVVTPSVRTIRTVTTVRTVRPLAHHRVAVTRRTYVSDRVVPSTTTTTTTTLAPAPAVAAAYPAPLYDYVTPAPVAPAPYYSQPLYDTVVQTPAPVAPAPAVVPAAAGPVPAGTAVPVYRYVYQPDRILVIDPNTGIAVQAIPR